jgi:hypothetical protein
MAAVASAGGCGTETATNTTEAVVVQQEASWVQPPEAQEQNADALRSDRHRHCHHRLASPRLSQVRLH